MGGAEQFRSAIISHDLPDPGYVEPDGQIHRFGRDKACWYVCFINGDFLAGAFGDWREGGKATWNNRNGGGISDEHRAFFSQKMKQFEAERKAKAETARAKAKRLWHEAKPPDPDHPYLVKKRISAPKGIRQKGRLLVVPVRDLANDEIMSLQFITPDGGKRFLSGGKVQGGACLIDGDPEKPVMLCEGWATGQSIHEATGASVVVAFNAGNLKFVAEKIIVRFPNSQIVICGDDDAFTTKPDGTPWNPGREKALSLAWAMNWPVAFPEFVYEQ